MDVVLRIVPLLVVLVTLLPPFRAHVLVAGLLGGATAALIGGLGPGAASTVFLEGLVQIMSITSVMMFAATALLLARAGSVSGLLEIIQGLFRGRLELVAAGMVLVQALAAYAAGTGAANTLVTAPLVYALVGFVPLVVVGMSIVSGASWATSPASAESAFISQQMRLDVGAYAEFMRPYTVALWTLGVLVAWYGAWRLKQVGKLAPPPLDERVETPRDVPIGGAPGSPRDVPRATPPTEETTPAVGSWRRALPFLVLLGLILAGPPINRALGAPLFTTLTTPLTVLVVAALSMRLSVNKMGEMFIDGGLTILRYLFMVGLFLGFINMMGRIGTFEALAGLVRIAPTGILVVVALVAAFLIAIPSAAYTVAIDALIIPVLAAAGVPIFAFGFVGIAVAQGAMISPVQINVAATAHGFRRDILDIVRNNLPYMPAALVATIALTLIATVAAR